MTANRREAALALHRFGYGPARNSIGAIADDPRGAVLAELDSPQAGRVIVELPSSAMAARAESDFQTTQRAKQKLLSRLQKAAVNPCRLCWARTRGKRSRFYFQEFL